MQTLPDNLADSDITQWLSNGVFLLDGLPAMYVTYAGSMIICGTANGMMHRIRYPAEASRVQIHWPACGALNVNGVAVYLERVPAHIYRRTYNSRCLRLTFPDRYALHGRPELFSEWSPTHWSVINAAFNPVYPSVDEAFKSLERAGSVAINPHLILLKTEGEHAIRVYFRGQKAGFIEGNTFLKIGTLLSGRRIMKMLGERITLCE